MNTLMNRNLFFVLSNYTVFISNYTKIGLAFCAVYIKCLCYWQLKGEAQVRAYFKQFETNMHNH